MAGLKYYDVKTDGGYTTTLQLSDEDAKLRGLEGKGRDTVAAPKAKRAPAPKNKQAAPAGDKNQSAATGDPADGNQ